MRVARVSAASLLIAPPTRLRVCRSVAQILWTIIAMKRGGISIRRIGVLRDVQVAMRLRARVLTMTEVMKGVSWEVFRSALW